MTDIIDSNIRDREYLLIVDDPAGYVEAHRGDVADGTLEASLQVALTATAVYLCEGTTATVDFLDAAGPVHATPGLNNLWLLMALRVEPEAVRDTLRHAAESLA